MKDKEPITVSRAVYEGIMAVRGSGKTNMFDIQMVASLAIDSDHAEAGVWVLNNPREYAHGISNGFEVVE